jgi:hypothetical protein
MALGWQNPVWTTAWGYYYQPTAHKNLYPHNYYDNHQHPALADPAIF